MIFKKAFQTVLVFGLLLAGYAGYVRAFGFIASWFRPQPWPYIVQKSERMPSATEKEAKELARKHFGPNHWSINAPWKYYNSERRYWMFALNYTRVNQGKRFTFKPFAIIWRSKDGSTIKTVVGDEAIVDFDQPIDIIKPGTKPSHVVFAQLSNNVKVHDDRGTPEEPADDLSIGPLTYLDFDEPNLQVRTESVVVMKDRDMQATGVGMVIDLRPHEGTSRAGFNGAKTVRLKRNVHIYAKNVGRSGILPGSAKGGAPTAPVPIDLTCAGEMRIELAEPSPPPEPGQPPPPAKPTLAWFKRNVCVRRGTEKVDQLDCDELYLILFPAPKVRPGQPAGGPDAQLAAQKTGTPTPPPPASPAAASPSDGPLTELTLRRAEATGHAVWLQSEAQAAQILGTQLIYEKNLPEAPDKTYIEGSPATPLWIVKTEFETQGPNTGKVKYIDTIRTQDVTLFDSGQGSGKSTVWARGPGKLETRTTKTAPVSRMATWQVEAVMRTDGQGDEARRTITLIGQPRVSDVTSGTLTANRSIVAWLRPKDPAAGTAGTTPAPTTTDATSSDTMRIERVEALQNVRLVKASDEMFARDRLNAIFEVPPPANPAPAPASNTTLPAPAGPAQPAGQPTATPAAPEPEKAARPPLNVEADRIWARILQPPGEKSQGEVQEARLRGNVKFHQDPAPEKTRGTDVAGYGVDLYPQGQGRYLFQVESSADQMAEVSNDEFNVKAAWSLAMNQATDYAWVDGPGTLTQMVHQGLLNDGGLDEDVTTTAAEPVADDRNRARGPRRKEPPRPKVPLIITWRSRMEFRGRTSDEQGGQVAKADFFTDVVAYTDDAQIFCQRLEAFMDRTVAFTKPKNAPATPASEPKAQIAFVRATAELPYRVNAINTKRDPVTGQVIEKQRVLGQKLTYDKASGEYEVPGAGMVWLYAQRGEGTGGPLQRPGSRTPQTAGGATSRTAGSGPAQVRVATGAPGSAPVRQGQKPEPAGAAMKDKPLELTRIRFAKGMKGRFGSGKDTATASPREAEFAHNVEVLHGPVKDERQDLDPDRPPLEYVYLTSQNLIVVSEPPPPGSNTASHDYLNAYDHASASTRDKDGMESTIQADQITYDSAKKLFYYYGYEGRQVAFQQSAGPGQPTSNGSAESGFYNYETGQSGMNAPQNFRLFDAPKTGTRAADAKEPTEGKPKKPVRRLPRMPGRSDKERRGFNGR